jgi:hypothetical protein
LLLLQPLQQRSFVVLQAVCLPRQATHVFFVLSQRSFALAHAGPVGQHG